MTYSVYDQSARLGSPVELFEFTDGSQTWRYTAYDQDYTWNGQTWTAIAIGRGSIQQSGKLDQAGIEIRLPRTNAFAQSLMTGLSESVTSITVRRGHADDPDQEFIVSWKGRVVGVVAEGAEIIISCESILTSMRRQGLRRRWQKQCPHALYGRGCNLTQANYAQGPFPVASISGAEATVTGASLQPDGWYTGGILEAGGTVRFIMAHVGDVLTLSRPSSALANLVAQAGAGSVSATLYPGCDRTLATCDAKFNNKLNFGGWPYIPTKNPMGGSSIV